MGDTVSSDSLHEAILVGATRTREKRDELNRINVFPVVDKDTGTNLAHTMNAILNRSKPKESVRETLKDVARSALIGARGNSGAIFSQYFHGLSLTAAEKSTVTLHELAAYFREAYDRAYKAIETPVEGTVITLMRAWHVSYQEGLEQRRSAHEVLESSLSRIHQALEETRNSMKVLKAAGVVDAGALGYYHFMEGFVHALQGRSTGIRAGTASEAPALASEGEDVHVFGEGAEIPHRYCTEVLLETAGQDPEVLREEMRGLGDCLLLSAADTLVRIHLHTDRPCEVVRRAASHGTILEQKADDMVWQNLLAGPPEASIACVTDSIADLPPDFLFQHRVFVIPIHILIDDVSYLDRITVDGDFLAPRLDRASSSQLNSEQIRTFLAPILRHYAQVVVLTVSSRMSGTHARFREVLAEMDPDGAKTALVDTRTNSGAQALLVREAVRLIEAGRSLAEVQTRIEALRSHAKILVSVLDIAPMARSGRVSERIGDLLIRLRFKPLVTIDAEGNGTIKGVAFTAEKNRKVLLRALRGKPIGDYVVVHSDAPERAARFADDVARLTGRPPLYIAPISSVVTLFAGRGSVAVAYLEKEAT